jgi:hypothetical protein
MTGAWRLKNDVIPKPALPQVRDLRLNRIPLDSVPEVSTEYQIIGVSKLQKNANAIQDNKKM